MYSHLFNMNKCCLKMNLKEKSTRNQWEVPWESLVLFSSCRHNFKRESEKKTRMMEREKYEERKGYDIHRKRMENGERDGTLMFIT